MRIGSTRNRFLLGRLATSLCVTLMAVSAHATDFGDISVRVEAVTGGNSNNLKTGYDEYRVTVTNRSPAKPHRVTVELRAYDPNAIRRSVEVAPSSTVTVPMFMEGGGYSGAVSALIDGSRQRDPVVVDMSRASAWVNTNRNAYYLLVSGAVEKSGLMNDAAVVEGLKASDGEKEVAYLSYPSPPREWSSNWVGYSSFDGVVITAEELRDAPDAVRSALWRYVECGGAMVVVGSWEVPTPWLARRAGPLEEGGEDASKKASATFSKDAQSYLVGFGQVTVIDAAAVNHMIPAQWQAVKLGWKNTRSWDRFNYYDIVDINRNFPVVERVGIPVRGLFLLMLGFVIVIGPINLIWLARKRKKIWMLWTVPAISLVTCAAVTGFALLGEGVSATTRVESLTILDESSRLASTIGWTAFYSPVTPGDGLRFDYDTELSPVLPGSLSYRARDNQTVDLTNDQHLDSGWITARVPAYFKFRKSETRRERLTIRRAGKDTISVVNGLGASIRQLWVADRDGKIHKAENIPAGAQASLSLTSLRAAGDDLREPFGDSDWLGKMKYIEQNPAQYLQPGGYLATLDSVPFVEEGLKGAKTRKAHSLVYGVSAEADR